MSARWTGGLLLRTEDSNNDFLHIAQNVMEFWYYDSNNQKEKCTCLLLGCVMAVPSWKAANRLHARVEIQLTSFSTHEQSVFMAFHKGTHDVLIVCFHDIL